MTDCQKLFSGISKAAWGYFFLYFNININNVSILPGFVGYLLFLSAIRLLKEEERELSLLNTLGIIMALWTGAEWLADFAGIRIEGMWQFIDIVIGLINLYFHFQLLTNLASIAAKYQPEGYELDAKLLRYRTLQTVMLTAIEIVICFQPWLSEVWTSLSVCMMVIYLIAGICLMKALFDLRGCLATTVSE
ncbi:MAG: hypothetical protein SOT28_01090 [Fusicatenibacter sp.]|nr:hypothetical protein [Lachnospiraceae bacterium]MDY2936902.1 hypothetical protein [Fusicatenibacter sp.]